MTPEQYSFTNPQLQVPGETGVYADRFLQIKSCAAAIAKHLGANRQLLLDVDGVICQADALDFPRLTAPSIISSIRGLEDRGIAVGVATARGMHIVDYLREEHSLQLEGSSILEEGQMLLREGRVEHTVPNAHRMFIRNLREKLQQHSGFRPLWQEVEAKTFCPGDRQWQGQSRASLLFRAEDGIEEGYEILVSIELTLAETAKANGLDPQDIVIGVNRMSMNNLGIITINGKKDGQYVDKGIAAKILEGSWVFVADGFGDSHLALVTKERGGLVVGIEGNLDVSSEPPKFLTQSHYVLVHP